MPITPARSEPVTTNRRRRVAVMLLLIITAATACRAADSAVVGQEPADPLEILNNSSRMLYAQAKATAMARKDPVLIVVGDDLVLRKGEKRTSARVIPQIYHTLKSFAHIPMALDVALASHGESPLNEETLRELRDYRGLFAPAGEKLATAGLDGEERERQKAILTAATTFLDSILTKRCCMLAERIAFARQMNPLVMANAAGRGTRRARHAASPGLPMERRDDARGVEPRHGLDHRPPVASQGQPGRPVLRPAFRPERRGQAAHLRRGPR